MDSVINFLADLKQWLSFSLFKLGQTEITLWLILNLIFYIFLLFFVSSWIRKLIEENLLGNRNVTLGVRSAIGKISKYTLIVIGFMIIIQTLGIDLSALAVLAGAVGVGIGFGLQNITSNLIAGIIILFERPIKVGDRIEVNDVFGTVQNIKMRSTTILTNNNVAIIVPNSEFISSNVTNLSYTDDIVRFDIPVGIAYGSDTELVTKILIECAEEEEGVLKDPKSDVLFEEFGDSSLNFTLRVWSTQYQKNPRVLKSRLNYAIDRKFRENKIEIPFPQRDLNIRDKEINVRLRNDREPEDKQRDQ